MGKDGAGPGFRPYYLLFSLIRAIQGALPALQGAAAGQIRWGMFVSQLMKKRRNELKDLESKLGRDEKMRGSPFADILKSVYASENSILKECVTTFKNHLAADLEVFFK